mgnify:CR=1 FL=1
MKHNCRRIIGLCIAALLLCTGCAPSAEEPQKALMRYMENRYPEDNFTWWYNALGGEGENTYQTFEIIMHSEKYPDAAIHAARWKKDGEFIYADNYMAYYLQDDVEAFMQQMAEKYFGECKVYEHISNGKLVGSNFPTDATVEDYLKSKPSCSFAVFISPGHITLDEAKRKMEQFEAEFEDRQYDKVGAGVYIIPNAEDYAKAEPSYGQIGSKKDLKSFDFVGGISSLD